MAISMNIEKIRKDTANIINDNEKNYVYELKKLERKLLKEIRENPKNFDAYSLLAFIKNFYGASKIAVKHLKKAIALTDSNDDYSFIATNLAYILHMEPVDENSENEAAELLQKAANINSPFAETYYALAMHYFQNKDFPVSLNTLKKRLIYLKAKNTQPLMQPR